NSGLQNHAVLYVTSDPSQPGKVLIDPNTFSSDGTVSLAGVKISPEGTYVAYGKYFGGSDWTQWFVKEVNSGEDLQDHIRWVKFSSPAWSSDERGFYYSRFPEPLEELRDVNENQKVYYHELGSTQDQDRLVFENTKEPRWLYSPITTEDGRF